MHDDVDDNQLIEALAAAINARRAVPVTFVQVAAAAYTWHDIDADLELLSGSPPGAG